jgi:hypothetical protein
MGVTAPGVGEAPWGAWAAETVSDGYVTGPSSLALTDDGRPVIGAWGDGLTAAYHERTALGTWNRVVVQEDAQFRDLVIGPDGRWHVVYFNHTDLPNSFAGSLTYAVETDDGRWRREVVRSERASAVNLVVDGEGDPMISVGEATDLWVFTRSVDGSWSSQRVAGSGIPHDLALDAEGDAHIAFGNGVGPGGMLRYVEQDDGAWGSEQKVLQGCGQATSLTTFRGRPRVACHHVHDGGLEYVRRSEGGGWQHETADDGSGPPLQRDSGNVGWDTSIRVDGEGEPHIGYRYIVNFGAPDIFQGTAHYASKGDGEWVVERIEHPGNQVSGATSIALDEGGRPHVSWVLRARVHGLGCTHPANSCFDLQYARPVQGEAPAPPGVS